jgi:hypothetical protein
MQNVESWSNNLSSMENQSFQTENKVLLKKDNLHLFLIQNSGMDVKITAELTSLGTKLPRITVA